MNGNAEAPERTAENWHVLMTPISVGLQDLNASMYSFSGYPDQKPRDTKSLDLMEKEFELHSLPNEYRNAHPKPACHH